ncbi:protein phosphatase 2C-like protein [Stackebrandtia albiflava]|uniref:Protein phosphatase 2C-like protein n=1 Tax=Stackebrandtia albiflava TaxID=406432 RepID=A0A562V4T4_9ACTN|nr:protein phosphatase 2C domain-containing protein [Stackebrandtia albiflava]TWJ12842.1 protein phosphatase 2C-like protein [Stackebrandtia albiflava]
MDVIGATRPAPGRVNDDGFVIGAGFAAVFDGCTDPGRDSGCSHDVPWLVARLAGHLSAALLHRPDLPLPEVLAEAIRGMCGDHGDCDLSNPDSPSTTVTILRETGDRLEYLALADSPLVLRDVDGKVTAVVDDQVDRLPSYTFDAVAYWRNRPGGFWVASTSPEAAHRGVTGEVPRASVRDVLLMTDGVSRLVDRYGYDWERVMDLADEAGPLALIETVHGEDARAGTAGGRPEPVRGKRFDDATAVLCRIPD